MNQAKVGLLPFYLELYDETVPEIRPDIDAFHEKAVGKLREAGLEVVDAPVCRLEKEFLAAVKMFEDREVDAVVTLHLAYSPSLESQEALKRLQVPILVLDTTPDYVYDQTTDAGKLMLNHGIHGVQDMCNLLVRNHKLFRVFAGHMEHSDVMARLAEAARAAGIVRLFCRSRVGLIGEPFHGMGDFQVDFGELERRFGIETVRYDFTEGERRIKAVTEQEIQEEYQEDQAFFEIRLQLTRQVYDRSQRTGLAVRRWLEEKQLTAFTVNFLATAGSNPGLPVMPFTECSKAMMRGIGYAGEGDVLTAAFTGALLQGFSDVTFTEMFCPDWRSGSVFLSHMGEFNYRVAAGKPILQEKPFPFTDAENPSVAYRTMKPGRAVFVNLAPLGGGEYLLTAAAGEMLSIAGENSMEEAVNGWFRPDVPLERFLELFSQTGGTHHSVLIYGGSLECMEYLADFLGIEKRLLVP